MNPLLDLLQGQIGGGALAQVSQRLGADQGQTTQAVAAALPMLLGALARNAAKPDGAQALHGALTRDHDGRALDDLPGALNRPDTADGNAILGHVFGERRGAVETGVSRVSGLDGQRTGQLMAMLAPVVMGALGRMQRQKNLDSAGLASALAGERQGVERASAGLGGLTALLDADGDGQIMDDVVGKLGNGVLGGLFGSKK